MYRLPALLLLAIIQYACYGQEISGTSRGSYGKSPLVTKAWLEKPIPRKRDTLKPEPKQVLIEEKKEQIKPVQQTIINERPVKLVKTFEIDSADADSLTIEITDNARIDNDMISVYINDVAVIYKQVISHTPIVVHTALTKQQPESTIKMIAESYGSMPPCTARMSIITPRTTFTTNIESNYGNNGAVLIKLAK